MFKKLKYISVFFLVFVIISYGFIKVSSGLPEFIKDRSSIKVTYKQNPFDLEVDVGKYIIYLNDEALKNMKNNTIYFLKNLAENNSIKNIINQK